MISDNLLDDVKKAEIEICWAQLRMPERTPFQIKKKANYIENLVRQRNLQLRKQSDNG